MIEAQLILQNGTSTGQKFAIAKRFTKVGSDQRSDVCLLGYDLPEKALIIEKTENAFIVHNKIPSKISVGGVIVAEGNSSPWPCGEVLNFGDGYKILLEKLEEAIASPSKPVPKKLQKESVRQPGQAVAVSKKKSSNVWLYYMIGLLAVLLGLVVARDLLLTDKVEEEKKELTLSESVGLFQNETGKEPSALPNSVLNHIQLGKIAEVRKQKGQASEHFNSAKTQLRRFLKSGNFVEDQKSKLLDIEKAINKLLTKLNEPEKNNDSAF